MSSVFLCEKYNQAVDVAAVLGVVRKHDGYIETKGGMVTWVSGHSYELLPPDGYDEQYKSWSAPLPIVPSPFRYQVRDARSGSQLKAIKGLLAGCARLVLCTDADREGELIGREVLRELRYRGPIERAWFTALTKKAITKALGALLPGAKTEPLYQVALARSHADWLVGMNLTRALSRKLANRGTVLSVGRVQTPTLALLVRRERDIRSFKAQTYFEIKAEVEALGLGAVVLRHAPPPEGRILDKAAADAIAASVAGAVAPISSVEEAKRTPPPPFYALSSLQSDADRLLGWDSDKTLKIAQSLYDQHKVLTYPRTDCAYLPDEFTADAPALLAIIAQLPELAGPAAKAVRSPILRKGTHYVQDDKLGSHHAITLTGTDPSNLPQDERALFLLVCKRFLAAHLPDYEYLATTLTWKPAAHAFLARGSVPTFQGWREAFSDPEPETGEDGEAEAATLPKIQDGTRGTGIKGEVETKITKPPTRFTEGQLIEALKNVARFVADPAAKSRLRATSGLGTEATRGPMIKMLKGRGYIEVVKRRLAPSELAMELVAAIERHVPAWADPVTTALWEDGLEQIADGKLALDPFVAGIVAKLRGDIVVLDALAPGAAERIGKEEAPRSPSGAPRGSWKSKGAKSGGKGPSGPVAAHGAPGRSELKVSFADKDKAKALGARWDADRRTWYVPPGVPTAPFQKAGFLAA